MTKPLGTLLFRCTFEPYQKGNIVLSKTTAGETGGGCKQADHNSFNKSFHTATELRGEDVVSNKI